jgi:hypothetical protein
MYSYATEKKQGRYVVPTHTQTGRPVAAEICRQISTSNDGALMSSLLLF